jgi:hypothetical protein
MLGSFFEAPESLEASLAVLSIGNFGPERFRNRRADAFNSGRICSLD